MNPSSVGLFTKCGICQVVWDTSGSAERCCTVGYPKKDIWKYRCYYCNTLYNGLIDARDCCHPYEYTTKTETSNNVVAINNILSSDDLDLMSKLTSLRKDLQIILLNIDNDSTKLSDLTSKIDTVKDSINRQQCKVLDIEKEMKAKISELINSLSTKDTSIDTSNTQIDLPARIE